jgi:tetratricopeptide (TPR) repeat protein
VLKKAIFILIVILLPLLYYGGFLRRETLPFSRQFFTAETLPSAGWVLSDLKEGILKTSIDGKPLQTDKKGLEQLYQLKLDRGIRNLSILSFSLIREAEQARQGGEGDQAVLLATYAIKFSPNLPQAHFALAREYWHQNPFQISNILSEFLEGQIAQFRHYPCSLRFFYNLFYILSNAVLMTFIVFGIVIMVKYLPLYLYEIRRNLIQEISSVVRNSFKIFVLFLPFFFRLDILWAMLFWSILLWGYATKRERQLISVFFVLLIYLPFFLRSSSSFLDSPSSDVIVQMYQANQEDPDAVTAQGLQSWLSDHPNDAEVLFTLGLIEKRRGRYGQAEEFYRKAIDQAPKFSKAFSNLGNVYMARKEYDPALNAYQQAIALDHLRAAYHYNLYRTTSQKTFISKKTDQAFQRARQLDSKLIDYYTSIDSSNMNRVVIDEVLSTSRLWQRILSQLIGREGLLFHLFRACFENIPSRIGFLSPIFFLGFLIGMYKYTQAKRFLIKCPMCGVPTYRIYLGPEGQEFICSKCSRILLPKGKIHPRIVEKRSEEVRLFQKQNQFAGRFLSLFFVGFGYLWREHPFKGLFFLLLFFIFILRFVYWNGVILAAVAQPSPVWSMVIWGGLFILFYFLIVRKTYRLDREAEPKS